MIWAPIDMMRKECQAAAAAAAAESVQSPQQLHRRLQISALQSNMFKLIHCLPRVSSGLKLNNSFFSLRYFSSVFHSVDSASILDELKSMKNEEAEGIKRKQLAAKNTAAKIRRTEGAAAAAAGVAGANKSIFESASSEDSDSSPASGAPSAAVINKLRQSGRNRDDSEIYDRFSKAMQYRNDKINKDK
jgi:hypothetical protein